MAKEFKLYQKVTVTEIRPYEEDEGLPEGVGIADYYLQRGSPKAGDMICRNRDNYEDVWLVDKEYFYKHYRKVD